MPWDSKAQARWGHAAAKRGDFPAAKVAEYDKATSFERLPERATKKAPAKRRGPASGLQRSAWLRAAARRKYAEVNPREKP